MAVLEEPEIPEDLFGKPYTAEFKATPMLTYRNDGPWGKGKSTALTSAEVDNNFWTIEQALLQLSR